MYEYLKNLLPRVKQFSKDLDEKELFNDKHWILVDDEGKRATYVFKREGRLIVSLSGVPKIGTWEYISAAKSLLLSVGDDKAFLSFSFFNDALFVLKKDDDAETPWILVNKNVIPDLNIKNYLNSLLPEAERSDLKVELELESGIILSIIGVKNLQPYYTGFKVLLVNSLVSDGLYEIKNEQKIINVKESKIIQYLFKANYKTEHEDLIVFKKNQLLPEKGDMVFLKNYSAPTGKYIFPENQDGIKSIKIENGQISKIAFKGEGMSSFIFISFWCFIFILIILFFLKN